MTSQKTAYPALAVALALSLGACGKEASIEPAAPQAPTDESAAQAAAAAAPAPSTAMAPMADDVATTLPKSSMDMIFSTPIQTLDGEPSSIDAHQGKALLLVNVASKCGLTPQYADLEKLQKEYAAKGFTVLGFPCNQFGGQEPGSAEEIKEFCSLTYGVTFPMFEKIEVNGPGRHAIYQELTQVKDAEGKAGDIQWNFEKFVISADRQTITRFRPRTEPYDPDVIAAIEAGLPKAAM